jgi:biopolymer transport protein TolQ
MMNVMTLMPHVALLGAISLESAFGSDIVHMVMNAGAVVKLVLLILSLFSVVSWTIIFMKWRLLRKARQETTYFLDLFWHAMDFNEIYRECDMLRYSPVAHLFGSAYAELRRARKGQTAACGPSGEETGPQALIVHVERMLKRTTMDQTNRMERALSFLATTGNTAPFIGLFGTVWGIMESFRGIGLKGSANLAVVAPGISEALIATAAGLAAAIPAVVAFNYFNNKVMALRTEMDVFSSDFLSLVERQAIRKQVLPGEIQT